MVSSVSPVTGWVLVRATFTIANCFFEAFLTVLRVLTQFLLIFEVFELFLASSLVLRLFSRFDSWFWGIWHIFMCRERSSLLCFEVFELFLTLDSCFESFLAIYTYFWAISRFDYFSSPCQLKILKKPTGDTTGDTGDTWKNRENQQETTLKPHLDVRIDSKTSKMSKKHLKNTFRHQKHLKKLISTLKKDSQLKKVHPSGLKYLWA